MKFNFQSIFILLGSLLVSHTFVFHSHSNNPVTKTGFEYNHLDPQNIERLEKMFYLKNRGYNPFHNQYLNTIKLNSKNSTKSQEPEQNIQQKKEGSQVYSIEDELNSFKERFMKTFEEELKKSIEEEIQEELKNENQEFTEDQGEDRDDDDEDIPRSIKGFIDQDGIFRYNSNPKVFLYRSTPRPDERKRDEPEGDSENIFQVVKNSGIAFADIGGYHKVKKELLQISDILLNSQKYRKFNVRTPKGIIFEGPPGNGKTLLAKGFCGELNISFIPVSGSEFTEKYVGVGASRVRDLFKLAERNSPCIIFIDEIDALARKRGNDEVSTNTEKDQTLNQLLINMDGFKGSNGVFVIGATNRVDLLDNAVTRPGRMDKNIFIGNPDSETRREILNIHLKGKPIDPSIPIEYLVEMTGGFSGAQIENLLNESMLKALRENREIIKIEDIEYITNRIISGWQSTENKYSDDIIQRIVIHEMGHAIVGLFSKEHSKLAKVCLNLWSPKSPGYTIFENNDEDMNIHTKNCLLEHLMVLLGGRIAEEIFYGYSVTTGAKKDLEQAYQLAQSMILTYGMGKQTIYPDLSEQSKYAIDQEINSLLLMAHENAFAVIIDAKDMIIDCSELLKKDKVLKPEQIIEIIDKKYSKLWTKYDVKSRYE